MTNPKRLGKYELQMRLGQGGMAEVWKAFDPQLQRLVAIKFLHANLRSDPDFTNRFIREGQAIAALRHPNIVQVYDFLVSAPDDENPMAYMVMDYVEGPTLADYLSQTSYANNIPTHDEVLRLFASLGLAVDYAHMHRMIHRDIKPSNILLDTSNTMHCSIGEPILTDFGIVKILGGASITNTGISMGTPLYISPEMVNGQVGNEKSDIYALGVILYEICTGTPPYVGDNPYVILAQRVTRPPDPPSQRNPQISSALDEVILCCLAMNPVERFASASDLTTALAEAFDMPVPDMVRHALLLRHPSVALPSNLSVLPVVATPPSSMPLVLTPPDSCKSESPLAGGETIPSASIDGNVISTSSNHSSSVLPETSLSDTGSQKTDFSGFPYSPPLMTRLPSLATMPVTYEAPGPPPTRASRQRWHWHFSLRIVLLVVLIGVGMGISTFMFLHNKPGGTLPGSLASVGSAAFVSSGQLDSQNTAFLNDGIQVYLNHIPDPSPGYRYYAWMQPDRSSTILSIFLGVVQAYQGHATLSYIDSEHRNLLAVMSSLLVTEQSASALPEYPSRDRTQWKYVALLPQAPSSIDHMSYLDYLRNLLVSESDLEKLQLHHGINFWFQKNIQEMYIRAIEVRESSNHQVVRQLLAHLLFYLDGPCAAQEMGSTLMGENSRNGAIERGFSIPLLDCGSGVKRLGYLTRMIHNLDGMINAPGVLAADSERIGNVRSSLQSIQAMLVKMREIVLKMIKMDDRQMMGENGLRNELVSQGSDVTSGYFDPVTQTLQPGVKQISDEVTNLAHFTVLPYL